MLTGFATVDTPFASIAIDELSPEARAEMARSRKRSAGSFVNVFISRTRSGNSSRPLSIPCCQACDPSSIEQHLSNRFGMRRSQSFSEAPALFPRVRLRLTLPDSRSKPHCSGQHDHWPSAMKPNRICETIFRLMRPGYLGPALVQVEDRCGR